MVLSPCWAVLESGYLSYANANHLGISFLIGQSYISVHLLAEASRDFGSEHLVQIAVAFINEVWFCVYVSLTNEAAIWTFISAEFL